MTRRFCILLAVFVSISWITSDGLCSTDCVLDIKARVSIGNITDEGDPGERVEIKGGAGYQEKSVTRAMLLSAMLPGLGQIYVGGRRGFASGGAMAATDVFSVWRYFTNNGKGDDKKGEYETWARDHYSTGRFNRYVEDTIVVFSGWEDFGICMDSEIYDSSACWDAIHLVFPLSEGGSGAFYEQIGAEDRYVFGWDDWTAGDAPNPEDFWVDWNPYGDLPDGIRNMSLNRHTYRSMRKEADDFYGAADRYAWIMVIGRVVSMIDAAILVKLRNRDLAGIGTNPRLCFKAKMGSNPNVKIGLKLRF